MIAHLPAQTLLRSFPASSSRATYCTLSKRVVHHHALDKNPDPFFSAAYTLFSNRNSVYPSPNLEVTNSLTKAPGGGVARNLSNSSHWTYKSSSFVEASLHRHRRLQLPRLLPQRHVRFQLPHHLRELRQIQRLRPIADGLFGRGVHLHDQSIRANRHPRARQRGHQAAPSCRVAGIQNHRQVRQFLQRRNRRDVASVSRHRFKRANPPLAQNHLGISVRRNIFRGHQQFFYRAAQPALQQHRPAALSERLQQHEILHVARTHLHHVGIFRDQFHVAVAHHFRDNSKPRRFFRFLQQLQSFFFHPLEVVRRSTRLERAAAQQFRAGLGHAFGALHNLLLGFHRTRPGNHHKIVAAKFRARHSIDLDTRFPGAEFLAHEFVRRGNAHHFFHLRHGLHGLETGGHVTDAHHADHHALFPFDRMHLVPKKFHLLAHLVDGFARRMQLHGNNHRRLPTLCWIFANLRRYRGPHKNTCCKKATAAKTNAQKQKSPLSASGLKSFTAFLYNRAPRTSLCGVLKNRYPNQKVGFVNAVELDIPVIVGRSLARELVYFVSLRM